MFRVQVTFRDMAISEALEARCWDEAATLHERFGGIRSCLVTISSLRPPGAEEDSFDVGITVLHSVNSGRVDSEFDVNANDRDVRGALVHGFQLVERRLRRIMRTDRLKEAGEMNREKNTDQMS